MAEPTPALSAPASPTEELSKKHLPTSMGVTAVGTIASQQLLTQAFSCLFVNSDGTIERVLYREVILDELPDDQAIQRLLTLGYQDSQVLRYLRGRDARRKATNG